MEWFYNEQLAQHHEWRRQKKRNDQVTAYRERDRERIMKRNNPHNLPLTRHWFNSFPLIERSIPPPPGFQDASLCAILPRPIETPKTPPSFTTASVRRRCMGSEPLSPPNPLRLASTNAPQRLPRPDPLPRFLRSPLPPLDCESIGDPRLRVFRVRLPDYLIHGPLDALIVAAEHYSKRLPNGWKTNLYSLTKCDIACRDIPGISSYIDPIMTYISMTMKFLYSCPKITMGHNQPHIVKYAKEIGHTGVELHCDRCDITANLSMSRRGSYRGGGTYIAAINRLVMLDKGEILMHPGNLVHGGNAITAGTRYLLVAFADLEK